MFMRTQKPSTKRMKPVLRKVIPVIPIVTIVKQLLLTVKKQMHSVIPGQIQKHISRMLLPAQQMQFTIRPAAEQIAVSPLRMIQQTQVQPGQTQAQLSATIGRM